MNIPCVYDELNNNGYPLPIPYSTEEIKIGTWIDGKPLYRKVFLFPNGGSAITEDITALNVDFVVELRPITYAGTIPEFFTVGTLYTASTNTGYATVYKQTTKTELVLRYSNAQEKFAVILEYTKTTD